MNKKQLLVAGTLFTIIFILLTASYFAFLRPSYVVLYDNIREADTSAIIAELEQEGVDYQLKDKGRKILVPEGDISKAKIVIAASPISTGSDVGFELFNESDMGLTDFAQKINFQRALQGELARTIMGMDDIERARVHLSLPERSLFRADSSPPKAAVTIQTSNGKTLSSRKVLGLQELISSSVPNLTLNNVVILDETGTSLNNKKTKTVQNNEIDERTALETYFRVRARKVIKELLPSLNFDVHVVASNENIISQSVSDSNNDDIEQIDTPASNKRNFKLTIILRTKAALNEEDRAFVQDALTETLALDLQNIDVLAFETGELGVKSVAIDSHAKENSTYTSKRPAAKPIDTSSFIWENIIFSKWLLLLFGILGIIVTLVFRQKAQLKDEDHQSLADQLNEALDNQGDYSNG